MEIYVPSWVILKIAVSDNKPMDAIVTMMRSAKIPHFRVRLGKRKKKAIKKIGEIFTEIVECGICATIFETDTNREIKNGIGRTIIFASAEKNNPSSKYINRRKMTIMAMGTTIRLEKIARVGNR